MWGPKRQFLTASASYGIVAENSKSSICVGTSWSKGCGVPIGEGCLQISTVRDCYKPGAIVEDVIEGGVSDLGKLRSADVTGTRGRLAGCRKTKTWYQLTPRVRLYSCSYLLLSNSTFS